MICLFSDLELLISTTSPPSSSSATDTAIMYLILFTALCGLATLPNMATAAAIPPHKPFHEATHVTGNSSDKGSEGEFLYVVASEEGGVETLNDEDFDITPEGHFVGFDDAQNDTAPTQKHEISPGNPDLPKPVLHAVLDEIAFAVEDDPLVREVVKTSLKSGGIPVEVLAPGQKSSNQQAILIEVFHLEDEGKEKSGEDQENQKNNAAVTDERLTLTGLLTSENNNEVRPSGLPAGSLSRLVQLVGKDVENVGERAQETRKRRNSVGNDTVAVQAAKVSSTTPEADSDSSTIIPSTVKNPAGFDKDLQLTTLSPKNIESSPSPKNYSSIILIMGSEEDDDDDDSDERVKRQGKVDDDNSQEDDLDATTEVTDSGVDVNPTPRPSPGWTILLRRRRQAEGGSDISTVNEDSLAVTILPSKADLSTESVLHGISSTTESNEELATITEKNISSTTEISEESVTGAQENIPITTESSEDSVSSTEENTSSAQLIVSSTVDSISSTEVSITKVEGSSANSIEEEETTLSVDGDDVSTTAAATTTTPSLENEVATTTEGNVISEEDPGNSSGEETTASEGDEDSSEDDDSSESTEKTDENEDASSEAEKADGNEGASSEAKKSNGNEGASSEAKTIDNADIILDFYDI
ncbi:uncharacterized protein LOC135206612 [Macrobrachium nipponense]|uniref:uncharacterized protein LOC135206612 n=1 Tax=Macrobrachium nipponense TaxID=159736 RepID=UPI0030C7CD59